MPLIFIYLKLCHYNFTPIYYMPLLTHSTHFLKPNCPYLLPHPLPISTLFIFHLLLPSSSRRLQLLLLFLSDGIRKDASKQQVVAAAASLPVGVGELLPDGLGDPRRGGPRPVRL
jgi:hypothetical protein